MIDYFQLLLLGAVAGFTIFLGIPFALVPARKQTKNFLNSLAVGILIFLLFDVLEHAWASIEDTLTQALSMNASPIPGITLLLTMFFGIAISLIGLSIYQDRFMTRNSSVDFINEFTNQTSKKTNEVVPKKLALMIAIGIGVHNLSEGLAIGQSFATGEISLALMLIIGFGAHNATEGFGIVGPLASDEEKPSLLYLFELGLIGGGPTFLGTILGSFWVSDIAYVLFLSLAAGALIFVILLMSNTNSKQIKLPLKMTGIFIGLMAGFLTDLIISLAGA